MIRKPHLVTLLSVAGAFMLAGFVAAQQAGPSAGQEGTQQHQGGMMSMNDMMKHCREHHQQTTASIDRLNKTIEEAKQSNDPEKMRAALDEVQKPLTEMKNHMSMCMGMMDMMQMMHQMHGGMGSMMQEPSTKGGESQSAPKKP